jgi:hypothetical protein
VYSMADRRGCGSASLACRRSASWKVLRRADRCSSFTGGTFTMWACVGMFAWVYFVANNTRLVSWHPHHGAPNSQLQKGCACAVNDGREHACV